jgi:branched-chain amino acid transport system ATP-binding protein
VLRGLSASYGSARALSDIDLTIEAGTSLGIVGENGAGKTTLLRTIARVHRRATGTIEYGGESLLRRRPDYVARLGIGLVRDGGRVFENLTIRDHLRLAERLGRARGGAPAPAEEVVERFPMLARRGLETKAGFLSGGQRQGLCLAMAVAAGSACLLLDEASAGLAESTAAEIFDVIGELAAAGMTLVVAEQDRRWLEGLVGEIVRLEMGRLVGPG